MKARSHTRWSFLLHFDKVSPALVVEPPRTSVVEQRYVQLFLQVTLHLAQLQGADTVGAVHREVLLVICAVGLAGRIKREGWVVKGEEAVHTQRFIMPKTHTHKVEGVSEATQQHNRPRLTFFVS